MRLLKPFVGMLAVAALIVATVIAVPAASQAQEKIVRIGFQKYGKLVLLKSKGTLEGMSAPSISEIPVRRLRSLRKPPVRHSYMWRMNRRLRQARRSWWRRTVRSSRWLTSRARRSR